MCGEFSPVLAARYTHRNESTSTLKPGALQNSRGNGNFRGGEKEREGPGDNLEENLDCTKKNGHG